MIIEPEILSLDKHFQDYFYGLEGYHLRCERFYDELQNVSPQRMREWMRAAFIEGAKCMANDTIKLINDGVYLDYHDHEDVFEPILDELKNDILEYYENVILASDGVDKPSNE